MKIEGHLRRWLEDACDMDNEGDRVAWEQYQELTRQIRRYIRNFEGFDGLRAALKAAEGE